MTNYELKNDVIHFTPMYSVNKRGQTRFKKMFIRLVGTAGTRISNTNWNLDDEKSFPINDVKKIDDGLVAEIWSETGQEAGKTLRSAPTYVTSGKNIGKKNATNPLTQAITDATSKWNKDARKGGYVTDKDQLNIVQEGRIKPMALHSMPPQPEDGKFDIKGTSYWKPGQQMYIALKADGNRMMANASSFWGRSGDPPPNSFLHIRKDLARVFEKNPDVILDGEIYKHGMPHQLINGTYMKEDADSSGLEYWVFDAVLPDRSAPYSERIKFLRTELKDTGSSIVLIDSELVDNEADIERIYKDHLRKGNEGSILRDPTGVYEAKGRKEVRSGHVLKLKPVYDSEFEIVGYKDGKGRDAGAITWILKMPDSNATFSAKPSMTLDERRALYKRVNDTGGTDHVGKMMRVLYGDTTDDGVPRFPRAIDVRILPAIN
jgi:hypothetical protein